MSDKADDHLIWQDYYDWCVLKRLCQRFSAVSQFDMMFTFSLRSVTICLLCYVPSTLSKQALDTVLTCLTGALLRSLLLWFLVRCPGVVLKSGLQKSLNSSPMKAVLLLQAKFSPGLIFSEVCLVKAVVRCGHYSIISFIVSILQHCQFHIQQGYWKCTYPRST